MRQLRASLAIVAALCLAGICAANASAEAPAILRTSFSHLTSTSVGLQAEVNPNGEAGKFHFEYGPVDCSANPCTATAEGKLKKGESPVLVETPVEGLIPGATYHFRVLAKSNGGEAAVGPDTTFTTYRTPQVFGPCPNESFRSEQPSAKLPDCRAYEQASPLNKNGVDAQGQVPTVKASINGDAISYGAAGGIPGAEGSQVLPAYLASRGAGNWSTQGLLPPESAGQEAFVLGWTSDFSQTFSAARRLGPPAATAFLERSSANRSLTEIAPYGSGVTNPNFAGATADGSEIVFESAAKLTPEAIAGHSNVYAWDRTDKTIRLVGALNDKTSLPQGSFAGSYDWIAGSDAAALRGGGSAGTYYVQDQHAISGGGSVYFTAAGSGQLYLRQNASKEQSKVDGAGKCTNPELGCTIHVSATQKKNGTGPNGTDAAGEQPAAFLGASTDGSSVLFSSSEKLTDNAATGPEPTPPAIGRSGLDGSAGKDLGYCPTFAKGVAVDATYIYWASPKAGTIGRAKLNGAKCESPDPSFIVGANNPQYVAVDAGHVYWTNAADGKAGTGTIGRADINGTLASVNQEFITGASDPQGVAVDGEHVYWANEGDAQGSGEAEILTRTIGRAKLGGGGGEEVEQAFIQVDHGSQEERPQGLAVNATGIYWTATNASDIGFIIRRDLSGSAASEKFFGDGVDIGEAGVTLDASHAYWARQGTSTIGRINLALEAASAEREFVKGAERPQGVAGDGEHLYWSANGELSPNPGNDLYRFKPATGELSDLTVDTGDPNGAEVKGILGTSADATFVYFVANGDLDGAGPAKAGDCRGAAILLPSFEGECNLYLWREGQPLGFIARLDANGGANRTDSTDWLPRGGLLGQTEKSARVSADGSTVLYRSQVGGTPELYRYQLGEAGPTCISCNPSGAPASRGPRLGSINLTQVIPPAPAFTLSRNLSADGTRVFFETTEALVGADTNGEEGCPEVGSTNVAFPTCQDVYEWEAMGTGSCEENVQGGGCLYLLSTGKSGEASFFGDASASGDDAFLITSSPGLVRQDQDQLYDVYDAHLGGGLAAQNQVAAVPCEGDTCKPGPTPAPGFESPGSASFQGPGNPKPKKAACPKGKRKVSSKGKSRCVAKKQQAKKHQKGRKRGAKQSGRASR